MSRGCDKVKPSRRLAAVEGLRPIADYTDSQEDYFGSTTESIT
jgi:hypothetical protein